MRPPSLKTADFQRALGSRPVSRTPHFFLHALHRPCVKEAAGHVQARSDVAMADSDKLSTGGPAQSGLLVDDLAADISVLRFPDDGGCRLGMVLPKKQARRSVTRSLIRHQAREALRRHVPALLAEARRLGIDGWVVRLRSPFDRQHFPSAASDALKALVRQELDALWQGVKLPKSPSPPVYKAPAAPDARGAA